MCFNVLFDGLVFIVVYHFISPPYLCPSFRISVSSLCGSDCAVCAPNFTSGFFYSCHTCTERSKMVTFGLGTTVATVLLSIIWMVVHELVRKVDGGSEEQNGTTGKWLRRRQSCLALLSKIFPRTAVKIVVVVWQITTQVRSFNSESVAQIQCIPYTYVFELFLLYHGPKGVNEITHRGSGLHIYVFMLISPKAR